MFVSLKVNRKTLETKNPKGNCEVYNNHKNLNKKLLEMKIEYQKQYNQKLEGNKI